MSSKTLLINTKVIIPDVNFRVALIDKVDNINANSFDDQNQIEEDLLKDIVSILSLNYRSIDDLSGIENFINLKILYYFINII